MFYKLLPFLCFEAGYFLRYGAKSSSLTLLLLTLSLTLSLILSRTLAVLLKIPACIDEADKMNKSILSIHLKLEKKCFPKLGRIMHFKLEDFYNKKSINNICIFLQSALIKFIKKRHFSSFVVPFNVILIMTFKIYS